jgi:hypothetical protein
MASKNEKVPIGIPKAGIRRDVDPLHQTPEMLEIGTNVIVDEETLRPRPAHSFLGWKPTAGWWQQSDHVYISAAYKVADTRYVMILDGGMALETTVDSFATISSAVRPGYGEMVSIAYDTSNFLWIVAMANGDIWTAPATWPGAGSWTLRFDASSYETTNATLVSFYYCGGGVSYAIVGATAQSQCHGYYSPNGLTWSEDTYYDGLNGGRIYGIVHDSGGTVTILTKQVIESLVAIPVEMYSMKRADVGTKAWTLEFQNNRIQNFYDAVLSPDDNAGFLLELLATESKILKTTNLGETYTTQDTATDPEDFQRLFFTDSGAGSLMVIGARMKVSLNGTLWTDYNPPPFFGDIYHAIHDGTQWWIFSEVGVWRAPAVAPALRETVNSLAQWMSDATSYELLSATESNWRTLNQTTKVWSNVTQASTPAGPITAGAARNRWVFRQFEQSDRRYLIGANSANYPMVYDPVYDVAPPGGAVIAVRRLGYPDGVSSGSPPGYTAKIVLISASRVVFANGPASSPYGVDCSNTVSLPGGMEAGYNGLNIVLLGDTPGAIVAGAEISALQFVLYKEDAIYHGISQVEFGGVASPFRFEAIKTGIMGPVSPHSVVMLPDGTQLYFGRDLAIYAYDGQAPQDVGSHIRKMLAGAADPVSLDQVWGFYDVDRRVVWFFYPSFSGGMDRAIAIDPSNMAAWDFQLPPYWNAACGSRVFFAFGPTWDEIEVTWEGAGSMTWQTSTAKSYYSILGLEDDVWLQQRWDDTEDYTDLGRAINVIWKPGYAYLADMDRYVTLQEIRHVMTELADGESLTVTIEGIDDEQDSSSGRIIRSGFGIVSQDFEDDLIESDTLDSEDDERTTEHDVTAMAFRYQIEGNISRRFKWHGAVARFKTRGLR